MVNSSTITKLIIPQIERFATKFVYNKLTTRIWEGAMSEMAAKCDNGTGNTFAFIVNTRLWNQIQRTMSQWIRD